MPRRTRVCFFLSCLLTAALFTGNAAAQAIGCTLTLQQPGELGVSFDVAIIGSDEDGGREARLRIQTTFDNTISVDPPVLITSPAAYDADGQVLETAFIGVRDFAGINQSYTSSTATFNTGELKDGALELEARTRPTGPTVAGNYRLRLVVTCS